MAECSILQVLLQLRSFWKCFYKGDEGTKDEIKEGKGIRDEDRKEISPVEFQ
jgi:hypothetical protein